MTLAGIGISYLPRQCFQPLVDEGKLIIIPTHPILPPVPYVAMYANERSTQVVSDSSSTHAEDL